MDGIFSVQAILSLTDHLTGPLRSIDAQLGRTGDSVDRLSSRMGALAGAMTPIAVGAGAVVAGLGYFTKVAADFERSLSGVRAATNATADEMKVLERQALSLGASTAFSAMQVAESQTNLGKAGFSTNEILGAMPGVLALAASGELKLGNAAEIAAGTLRTFNMQAGEMGFVADVMAAAANTSNASVEGLGDTIKNAGTVAAQAGLSVVQLAAIAGQLSNQMIRGSEAGTELRTMLLRLQGPTGEAEKALSALGIQTQDAAGNMLPVFNILSQLEARMAGMGSAEKTGYLKRIFGDDAIRSVNALLSVGVDKVKEYATTLERSTGSAADRAATLLDNLWGVVENLSGAWESFSIVIGTVFIPALKVLLGTMANVLEVLTDFAGTEVGQWVIWLAGILSVGTLALSSFAIGWALLGPTITSAGLILRGVGASILGLGWPIWALVAAGAALYLAWRKNFGGIQDIASRWWNNISLVVRGVVAAFQSLTGTDWMIEGPLATEIKAAGLEGIVATATRTIYRVREVFAGIWDGISPILNTIWEMFQVALAPVIDVFRSLIGVVGEVAGVLFQAGSATDLDTWRGLGSVVGKIVGAAFFALSLPVLLILRLFQGAVIAVRGVASAFQWAGEQVAAFSAWLDSGIASAIGFITSLGDAFASFNPMEMLRSAFMAAIEYLISIDLGAIGSRIISTLTGGITAAANRVKDSIASAFGAADPVIPHSDAREGPFSTLTASGMAIMETLEAGVRSAAPGFSDAIRNAFSAGAANIGTLDTPALPNIRGSAAWDITSPAIPSGMLEALSPFIPPVADFRPGADIGAMPTATAGADIGAMPTATAGDIAPARERTQRQTRQQRPITIQGLTVHLSGVQDADDFLSQLKRYVERYDV